MNNFPQILRGGVDSVQLLSTDKNHQVSYTLPLFQLCGLCPPVPKMRLCRPLVKQIQSDKLQVSD